MDRLIRIFTLAVAYIVAVFILARAFAAAAAMVLQ